MIISASYKTDIPAFYAPWFQKRLRAGFCKIINPYNQKLYEVSLKPQDVQAYVFWSRNYQPFLDLAILDQLQKPFVCQMTVLNYPRSLDRATIVVEKALLQMREITRKFGQKSVVWRYDPIVITDDLTIDWHVENFARLAESLSGLVDEVVVSFVQFYQKIQRNFKAHGQAAHDLDAAQKQDLLLRFHQLAREKGIKLTLCAQPDLLIDPIVPAACIDLVRLEALSGRPLSVKRIPHRAQCGCVSSKDIGDYDSCPHGCLYCYAVENQKLAKTRFQNHDPDSPFLFAPSTEAAQEEDQLRLF